MAVKLHGIVMLHIGIIFLAIKVDAEEIFECPKYIYAFGDSYTDTGNAQAEVPLFYNTVYPYGMSYRFPDRPDERTRYSDGRTIIDFTTQAFRFPFIEPYSRHFGDFAYTRGVNFAYAGATAAFSPVSPTFSLRRQVDNYKTFVAENMKDSPHKISSALHFIPMIGGNDFSFSFTAGSTIEEGISTIMPNVLDAVKQALEELYLNGARTIAIFNLPPVGCSAYYGTLFAGQSPVDGFGCLIAYNNLMSIYNAQLKTTIYNYREIWDANIFLFDYYSATYEVIQNAETHGFRKDKLMVACCGHGEPYNFNPAVWCGETGDIQIDDNVSVLVNISEACPDPERYMIWDGEHLTQAFQRVMAGFFLTGRFVDGPPQYLNWKELCNLDFTQWH